MNAKNHFVHVVLGLCFCAITVTEAATNHLAFYLLQGADPGKLVDYTTKVENLKLDPNPVLFDSDFRAFSTNNPAVEMPTFTIKAEAARRLHDRLWELQGGRGLAKSYELCGPDTPFVLVASGAPIYLGIFTSPNASSSYLVPTVCPMPEFMRIRANSSNDVTFIVRMDGVSTNFTGVTGMQPPRDLRNDKRILDAIKRLGL